MNLDVGHAPAAIATRRQFASFWKAATPGDRWLSTRQAFDWTPEAEGAWIQVDLRPGWTIGREQRRRAAERIAYFVARRFRRQRAGDGGNVLIDGKPDGAARMYLDYPGNDHKDDGASGEAKYEPGHNYGVRITRLADGQIPARASVRRRAG